MLQTQRNRLYKLETTLSRTIGWFRVCRVYSFEFGASMSIKQTTRFRLIFALLLSSAAFSSLPALPAYAQTLSGSIVGDVSDNSHAAIPRATVTIRDMDTNETRSTTTNDAGAYTFLALPPSTYEVKATKEGF